jgi:hypothetical protein
MTNLMTDEQFENWKTVVKCNWLKCAGGMGLAGNGCCSFRGDFTNPTCPRFTDEDEYLKNWQDKT